MNDDELFEAVYALLLHRKMTFKQRNKKLKKILKIIKE